MTNDMQNAPRMEPPPSPPPTAMIQTWVNAVTKPREQTFAEMASSPNAKATPAYIWVFIAALIQAFVGFLAQGNTFRQMLEQQGLGNQVPNIGAGSIVAELLCLAPIGAVLSVIFFAIGTAIVQWVAKMFGGRGTYDKLAYTFGAIVAPMAIVSAVLTLLSAIPFVGFCFGILAGVLWIYTLILQIMATKAVNSFAGWGPAIGSVLIPGVVIGLLCCCVAFGLAALLGATFGNVFSTLGPVPFPTP